MIYAYKSNLESMTIIVAGNDIKEYEDVFKNLTLNHNHADSVELLSSLEMMMDEELTHLEKPVMKVFHKDYQDQDKFIDEYGIKIIDQVRASYFQNEMVKTTTKQEVASDLIKEKLKSEMLGEVYVSPSIEEVYGLNIHDPWKKEEDKKQKITVDDSDVMSEASFGDADTQRQAREKARMDADPNYVPVRKFLGASKTDKDDGEMDFSALIQIKSKESKKLEGTFTDEEKQEELNEELDKQEPKSDSNSDTPRYQNMKETTQTLEEMKLDYDDNLEYSKRKKTSFKAETSVNVEVESLPDVIKNKIKEITNNSDGIIPSFIPEFWYSPASIIDGYCVLPQEEDKNIVSVYNMDYTKTISVSITGPETKLIKKENQDKDALVLYSIKKIIDDKTYYNFILVRIK